VTGKRGQQGGDNVAEQAFDRAASAGFRIVTTLEFAMFPFQTAFAGMLGWDRTETERVLRPGVELTADAPDEVSTSIRVLNLPPLPELPEAFRGRQLVVIDGAVLASDERSIEILAGLGDLGPEMDTFGRVPVQALSRLHMDPEGPTPSVFNTALLDGMPESAIEAFVEYAGPGTNSTLLIHELCQLGGALGRPHSGAGAMPMVSGQFLALGVGIAATPEMGAAGQRDAEGQCSSAGSISNGPV
jgi:hypothetical protein